ncbi:transporter substrate-binding domain-containing protein [Thalassomonas sp. RHCl1]|uniref:substrate-binding periplasmic protein n=1 Tax=Thalassomonas sp. RHCl1 TaxID=2995320 RepID=UPI00248B5124|nr:transporter substrate-binding domain-containing protein [Thalassomonas sp. RHCl1]
MMKRLLLLIYGFIASLVAFNGFAQETIRISTGEDPPYSSEKYPGYGQTLNIVTQAFAQMNIKVEYGFFPWGRSYALAKENNWDATCCWTVTHERSKYFDYTDAIRRTDIVFFHLKSYPFDWQSVNDLKDIAIGATVLFTYGEKFDADAKEGKLLVEYAPSYQINLTKLLRGRIQLFPMNRAMGLQQVADLFTTEQAKLFTYHPKPLTSFTVGLMVSKKHHKGQYFIEMFNKGLKRLKASGKYDLHIPEDFKNEYQVNE